MSQIQTTFHGFALAAQNGSKILRSNISSLIWALVTTGRSTTGGVLVGSQYEQFEFLFKAAMLAANVHETSSGMFHKTDVFRRLDPSEKTTVSYYLGLMGAKLVSADWFRVPWLLHLDRYRDRINITMNEETRPDLIGLNFTQGWYVFEAKGRSNGLGDALNHAKRQARAVSRINGQIPHMAIAVGTYFKENELRIRVEDPENESDGHVYEFDPDWYLLKYYQDIMSLLKDVKEEKRAGLDYRNVICFESKVNNFRIGVDSEILRIVEKGIEVYSHLSRLYSERAQVRAKHAYSQDYLIEQTRNTYLGPDGVYIDASDSMFTRLA